MNEMQDNQLAVNFDIIGLADSLRSEIQSWNKSTVEIVKKLHDAQDYYSNRGHRSDLLTNDSKLNSFKGFLDYIGIYERKAYRWLERYIPEENKLLTYEEFTEKKTLEAQVKAASSREQLSPDERYRSMVSEFKKTGIEPLGWSRNIEDRMKKSDESYESFQKDRRQQQKDREEAERLQRVKDAKEKEEAATRPFVAPAPKTDPSDDDPKRDYYYNLGKISDEMLKNASTARATHTSKRNEWKEKIRLSDGGKDDAFMDAIVDYLETLPNDNRRIEACNNIIKICRNISVELQRVAA